VGAVTPGHGSGGASRYGPITRSVVARYSVALAVSFLALVAERLTSVGTDGAPLYALLVGAVAVAIWYGGPGPGVLAVVVAWGLAPLLLYSEDSFSFENDDHARRWGVSLAAGLIVVWISLVMRRGQERAASAAFAAEASTERMTQLQELASGLSAAVTPSDVAHELVDRVPGLLGAMGGAVGLIEGDDVVIVDPRGVQAQTFRPGERLPLSTLAPLTRAAAEGALQHAHDRAELEDRYPDGAGQAPSAQAALAVPLRAGGEVVGSMSFRFARPDSEHEDAESIALIAADLGGQALERALLYNRERTSRRALDRILRVAPRLYFGTAEEVSIAICREARMTLGADLTEIWTIDADWLWLELVCRDPDDGELSADDRLEIAELPGLRAAVENLDVEFVGDAEEVLSGELLAYARRLGIRSWLWAPIVVGGRTQRVLFFAWGVVISEPDASTVLLARRFSDQAGLAYEQLERRQAEEEAALRAQETRRLLDVTAALAAAATPAEVTAALLREGLRGLDAVAGVVVGRAEGSTDLRILDTLGYQPASLEPWSTIPGDAHVPLAEAVRDNRLIVVETVEELEALYPEVAATRSEDTGAWLVVPLSAAGSVIGAAGFSFAQARRFSEAELEFAEALARQSGQALERTLLLASEHAARTRAEELVVLTSALSQSVTPADVANAAGGHLLATLGAELVAFYVLRNGSSLELLAHAGGSNTPLGEPLRHLALDEPMPPAAAARKRRPVWLDTGSDWASYDRTPWLERGIERAGAVPLEVHGRLVGLLLVGFGPGAPIDEEARGLIESVARQTAQPLERTWLLDREQAARVAAEVASARTRRLQSITQALAAAPTRVEVASIVLDEALAAVAGDAAILVALDGADEAPNIVAQRGLDDTDTARELAGSLACIALSGTTQVVDDASGEPEPSSDVKPALAAHGFRSAICVPLVIGTRVGSALVVCFAARHRISAEDSDLLQTLGRIGAQALDRGRLFDEEQSLRRRSERIQRLAATLSGLVGLQEVAGVVLDTIVEATAADAAALSIVVEERQLQRKLAWVGYSDTLQDPWLEVPLDAATPGNLAISTRERVFYETLDALAEDYPSVAEDMRLTGHESFLFVPLVLGRATTGLVVVSWGHPVRLSEEEESLISTVSNLAAQALDRARQFESERTIAETLQRSVLPVSLPHVEGIQLAARYLPGTEEVDVGGDWFDAIQLPNGRIGFAVGDVVGKGVQSAATMAQLRNALRAFAFDQMKPSSTIARLNRLTEEISEAAFATLLYAVLDPERGVLRFSSAGHPPPLVVYPDGRAAFLEGGRGLPLGISAETRYRQQVVELPVGSTLLVYTDGLVERRGEPIDEGLARLVEAAETGPGEPERLVEHVLWRLVGSGERGDDIAILAIRLLAVAPRPLELVLPNESRSLDVVRDSLRVWLQGAPVSQLEAHEVVLAAWEACANAVEHPSPRNEGKLHVRATLADSCVEISVSDPGRWSPERERGDRGLGLPLMRSLMSTVDIDVHERGTHVQLAKRLAAGTTELELRAPAAS
jgi:serine phosphatase RsbU (regulator of sigma subunit)/anti-sigma regulatory factor (Ser/Thr protein kinase)